jgi:hypothetical protein
MVLETPDDLDRLVGDVTIELEALGLQGAARRLAGIRAAAFTTGSEWLGELGVAVKEIRDEGRIPAALDAKLERIMPAVRRAWPSL